MSLIPGAKVFLTPSLERPGIAILEGGPADGFQWACGQADVIEVPVATTTIRYRFDRIEGGRSVYVPLEDGR